MNLIKGLCAASITIAIAAAAPFAASQSLPAMAASTSGIADVNNPAAPGWLQRASLMMADENFRGAADQLRHIIPSLRGADELEAADFYLATALSHLPGEDAPGLFSSFLEKYPAGRYRVKALLGLAGALFDKEDYIASLAVYQSIEPAALSFAETEDAAIHQAYCNLKVGNNSSARELLSPLLTTSSANDARFYLAYIDYIEGKYADALAGFSKVKDTGKTPSADTPYYIAQLNCQLGNYAEALSQAKALLNHNCPIDYKAEMDRVAGESLYNLGRVEEAIPYLTSYIGSGPFYNSASAARNVLYILGENSYNTGDYPKAIEWLEYVVDDDNLRTQGALLLIGQSYMKQGDFDPALLAFDRAVKIDADKTLTENAAYNYAVAASQGGRLPFASSIAKFEEFATKYPNSKLTPAVNEYIINGYITDNNYGAALNAINRIAKPSDKVLAAKQQVLYLHGARQLQAGRTDDAINLLTQARALGRFSGETASEATLWLGEAYYKQGKYAEAVKQYATFLNETPISNPNHALALYDMAYGQFALKDFSKSADFFSKYLKEVDKKGASAEAVSLKADALNRLGDSYYYQKDLTSAANNYRKAIDAAGESADYPTFQLAIIKGLQQNHQGKLEDIASLIERFPASPLIPAALLEVGESYTALGQINKAINNYDLLTATYPSTPQGRQGFLLKAIGLLNLGETDKAITAYKQVISKYPTSEEARAASEDLKHIYADRGDIAAYTRFLASVPDAPKLEQKELAELQLEAVEKAYEAGRDNQALRQAEELIASYPDSPQAIDALGLAGELYEKMGKAAEAYGAYELLANKSSNEIDVNRARLGMLRISRDLGNNLGVQTIADQLLTSSSLGQDDRREVLLAKAIAYMNVGNYSESDKLLTQLSSNLETAVGAKAAYYLAQNQFDRKNLSAAEKTVNLLIDSNTPQEYWLARGFILLSDIKLNQGKKFESEEYIRSLRDNYPGSEPDIFDMINKRLPK